MSKVRLTDISQSFKIFTSKDINIGAFGAQADTGQVQKSVTWNEKDYQLARATLTLKANQSYASGAGVQAYLNQNDAADLSWGAFDKTDHDVTADVTAYLVNGSNIFDVWYKTAFPLLPFTQATATVSLALDVTFTYLGTGTPANNPAGAGAGFPTLAQLQQDVHNFFANTMNLVVVAVVVVLVALGLYAVISATGGGGVRNSLGALREQLDDLKAKAGGAVSKVKGRVDVELAERERSRMEGPK